MAGEGKHVRNKFAFFLCEVGYASIVSKCVCRFLLVILHCVDSMRERNLMQKSNLVLKSGFQEGEKNLTADRTSDLSFGLLRRYTGCTRMNKKKRKKKEKITVAQVRI